MLSQTKKAARMICVRRTACVIPIHRAAIKTWTALVALERRFVVLAGTRAATRLNNECREKDDN